VKEGKEKITREKRNKNAKNKMHIRARVRNSMAYSSTLKMEAALSSETWL
jgi:hypothetical protein